MSMRTIPAAVLGLGLMVSCAEAGDAATWAPPDYGPSFSQTWHDGNAEMATYKLTYPRYGELRTGTAVAITVTEPFDPTARVKADAVRGDTYNVVKLNLVEDFQTGVYDYNLMTSVFVATKPANGLPAGSQTKVSFSSQEWCGHVYQQALFSKAQDGTPGVKQTSHSYFEGEADQDLTMDHPAGGIAEDALMLWARGLAGPKLEPGESIEIPVYRAMAVQRLQHVPAAWETATLSRAESTSHVATPFLSKASCDVYTAEIGTRQYTFYVTNPTAERPSLLAKVTRSDGYELQLTAVERMPYWRLNGNADEKELKKIGLQRRGDGSM